MARGALLGVAVLVIALAVLTLGARVALPFADRWTAEIERGLGDYLGRPVSIESLDLRWRGTGPELRARGVTVVEDARRRISIDEALIDLDLASSALHRSPVFDELTLVGADIVLERDATARWSVQAVGGTDRGEGVAAGDGGARDDARADGGGEGEGRNGGAGAGGGDGDDGGLGWLFDARRVGLLDTRLTLVDAVSGPIVTLEALDLRVENDGSVHRMRLEARLPAALGGDLELGIDFTSGMRDAVARRATGRFHARADRVEAAAALDVALALAGPDAAFAAPVDARLAVELWGSLESGRLASMRGRAEAARVRPAGAPAAPVALDVVGGDFRFQRSAARPGGPGDDANAGIDARTDDGPVDWTIVADGLSATRGRQRGAFDVLRLERLAGSGQLVLEAGGRDLPVALAAALPLALAQAPRVDGPSLAGLRPRGTIERWSATLRPGRGAAGLDLEARIDALASEATDALPGIDALDVALSVTAGRGRASLAPAGAEGLVVDAPRLDRDPLAIDALDADLDIDLRPAGETALRIGGPVALETHGLELAARASLAIEPGRSPRLDLSGRFGLADAARVSALLPDRLLDASTVRWFRTALRGGRATNGELLVSGRLADFPYADGTGVFRADVDVAGGELDWQPGWPVAKGLAGSVRVEGLTVTGEVASGSASGLTFGRGRWRIADALRPAIELELSGRGALPAMLDFANTGPLASVLAPALGDVSGTGAATLDLAVSAPLTAAAARRTGPLAVDGTVFLSGNAVSFGRADVDLSDTVGAIGFDEAGFRIHRLRADWLGRPLTVAARTDGEGAARAARVTVTGELEARDVLAHYGLPLDGFVSGVSRWRAELVAPFDDAAMARDGVTLDATSPLSGTAIDLPAPLGKASDGRRPLALAAAFRPDVEEVRWSVRTGRGPAALEAHADVGDAGLTALALGLGGTPASVAGTPGVRLDGGLPTLALDGWAESLGRLIDAMPDAGGDPAPLLPVTGVLETGELTLFDAPLGPARLRLGADASYLNAALDNERLNGNVRWPRRTGGDLPALARLARVDGAVVDALLEPDEPAGAVTVIRSVPAEPPGGPDPRSLPPMRIRVGSLGWRGATLENLVIRTEPDVAGLRIDTLGFTHRDLQLLGEGYWRVADPQGTGAAPAGLQRTALSLTLQSGDFGAGLEAIGLPGLLARGAGRATARIGWPGPAWGPSIATLGGALRFDLEDGLIVPLDPGAGKLIGLFAFQALPRRLDLDFSDVTADGLAFSSLTGSAGIEDGVVDAALVRLAGPVGVVDVTGTTDLVARTLDQRVTVLPRVSAALPIIGVIAGGASAGVGALLAGGLLKALGVDLDRIGLRDYTLRGTWETPEFEPVRAGRM